VQERDLLGRVALIKKNLPAAENFFRSALALEPNRWQTLHNLSAVLLRQGRAADAAEVFQAAVRLQPQDPFLLRALANVTSRDAIIGAVVFSWLTWSGLSRLSSGLPAAARVVITGAVIAVCAALVFGVWSRRNQFVGRLSAPTMAVAKIERKFQRRRHDQRAAFTIGAPVAIWILGAVASFVIGLGLPLLLAFPIGLIWLFVAPFIWDRRVRPRLEAADQSKD
jgi:tetratricopeptide (TPR) repeat protein